MVLRQSQPGENGLASSATAAADTATVGKMTLVYVGADQTAVPTVANLTTANKFKVKHFELK